MHRNRLVLGVCDEAARERLLCEKECNLKKAVNSLRIDEVTKEQLRLISGAEEETVNVVTQKKPGTARKQPKCKRATKALSRLILCRYCGAKHHQDKFACPA